jgi:DNA polymerase-1
MIESMLQAQVAGITGSLPPRNSLPKDNWIYGYIYGQEIKKTFTELPALASFINSLDPMVSFVGANFKFDLLHLHVHGVNIDLAKWIGDTQLAAYVLTEKIPDSWLAQYNQERKKHKGQREAGKHSLKTLAPYFLGVEPFWEQEEHANEEYVLKDVEYTYRLLPVLLQKLEERNEHSFYEQKQLPWAKLLLRAELRGITLDVPTLEEMEVELTKKSQELQQQLAEQWHEAHVAYTELKIADVKRSYKTQKGAEAAIARLEPGVDYSSPKQMLWLLKDFYGYDCSLIESKTSDVTGKVTTEGTGAEVLERLANEGKTDVKRFLEYREVNKILTSYIPAYKALAVVDVLHPIYNPDSTVTGRTSSQRINLQQVPPALRRVFKAREGYSLVNYDAAAIEARIILLYTSDPQLYSIINSGTSIHDYNTHLFFRLGQEVPLTAIKSEYPAHRSTTKNVGFALFYNAGAKRIRITFTQGGFPITEGEARSILNNFRESYSVAHRVANNFVEAFEQGQVLPNLLGRPVFIEEPNDAYMKGFNRLIQGSASDLNLEAARRAQAEYDELGLDAHVISFIHDAIMVEAKDEQAEKARDILVKHMTSFNLECELGPIPLEVEGAITKRWEK